MPKMGILYAMQYSAYTEEQHILGQSQNRALFQLLKSMT